MKRNTQGGFTLIEILIAITILAFLMVGVYTIVSNSVDTKDRVLSEDKSYVQVMRALDRLQSDVAQLWSPLYCSASLVQSSSLVSMANSIDSNRSLT